MLHTQDGVYETLLQLGDACPAPATRREILHLLDVLPTWPAAVQVLRLLTSDALTYLSNSVHDTSHPFQRSCPSQRALGPCVPPRASTT